MPEIAVGILHSLTGSLGVSERPLVEAAYMAIDEINEAGGVLRHRIRAIVEDGASQPEKFARLARKLIQQDNAAALFGCWTSASRKAVKAVVEELDSLLWYPLQYEGLEESTHIVYTGSCLNQQIEPAVHWFLTQGKRRCLLIGSDYVYPRTANRLTGVLVKEMGGAIVDDLYFPLGWANFSELIARLPALKPDIIFNTLNGDSNFAFFRQLYTAGILANDVPCISFSISEREQALIAHEAAGHFTCWSYYQTLETKENREFVERYQLRYGRASHTSDPIMAAYNQPYLWKQAVENARSLNPTDVRNNLAGCYFQSPNGIVEVQPNHHVGKNVLIGRAREDGQFDVVWQSDEQVAPKPWMGVEDVSLAGRELIKEVLGQFPQMMYYANQLEAEISHRKEVEEQLHQSEGRFKTLAKLAEGKYRALFTESQDGIALIDFETGIVIDCNSAFQQLCDRPLDQLVGMKMWELRPPEQQELSRQAFFQIREAGNISGDNLSLLRPSGELIPTEIRAKVLRIQDQAIILNIVRDISERKRAEIALRRESEKNLAFLHNASDGIHILDIEGNIIEISDSFCTMLGYRREEMIGMNISQWDAQFTEPELTRQLDQQLAKQERTQFETRHRRKDGTVIDVEVSGFPLELDGKRVLFNSSRDITERKKAEASLKASEMRFRTIIEQSPIGMSFSRDGQTIEVMNAAFLHMFGYDDVAEICGQPVIDRFAPQCRAEIEDRVRRRVRGELVESAYEAIGLRKDGTQFPLFVSANRVWLSDGPLTTAFLIDITERKTAEEKIKHLAFYDQLTDLPNRQLFNDRLQQALASSERSGLQGAILLIDLDNFKTLNDTLGHDIGDLLLKQVVQRLASCTHGGDTVARLGGDEFVVLLGDLSEQALQSAEQTEAVAQEILATFRQPFQLGKHLSRCTASIGATLFSGHLQGTEELMKQADIALYQGKNVGRNTLRFFDPQMQNTINARATLEGELHNALEARQFHLYYQIQVDSSRQPLGAEVLIRWIHPERGFISPAQFIPMAEETGLILPIGHWVLETACAKLKAWERDGLTRDLVLAVNVSSKQFHQADFVAQVQSAMQRYAINPGLLKLELTESMLLANIEDTISTMNALKAMNVKFSLDDFGTGYSSLQYLKRLPLDQLKIDQSFVRDIATNSSDRAIVSTIISMAHSLDLDVIAEGVETEEQRKFLLDNGCVHYQGYLFSKPVSIEQFEMLLKQ